MYNFVLITNCFRYQLLHGNYQQAPQPKFIHQPVVNALPSIANYQVVAPAPFQPQASQQHYQIPVAPPQPQYQVAAPQFHTIPASSVPTSAPAQEMYAPSNNYQPKNMQLNQIAHLAQLAAQQYLTTKQTPAIITGFENFTPEQQAHIKSQLSAHFGQINDVSPAQQQAGKTQYAQQYSSKFQASLSDFVPSPQVKGGETTGAGIAAPKAKYSKM